MTKKKKQLEHMIWLPSGTGVPPPPQTFRCATMRRNLEDMKNMTRQEFVASLRRKSSGFSRGASIYRGVTRHHQHGRWQARIGRVAGNKDLYLGTFSSLLFSNIYIYLSYLVVSVDHMTILMPPSHQKHFNLN